MSAPPVPFYLIPPTRFTPRFQTGAGDGVIGDGSFDGVYWVIGHTMFLALGLNWGTTTAGTGSVVLVDATGVNFALPGNWNGTNVDTNNMLHMSAAAIPSLQVQTYVNKATVETNETGLLLVISPAVVLSPDLPAGLANGDFVMWQMQIPLVEPNMPR